MLENVQHELFPSSYKINVSRMNKETKIYLLHFCFEQYFRWKWMKIDNIHSKIAASDNNPSTHRVHKTWTFLIITHNSWYRSRKIKEDSSTEREKFPCFDLSLYLSQSNVTSRSQDFSNEKWSRNLQIGNAFNDWNSTISHANWQCLTNILNFSLFFLL